MKYAVGLMACIAIAFFMITSPERSQSHASSQQGVAEELPPLEVRPPADDKLDAIIDMLAKQQVSVENIDAVAMQTAVELEDTKQRLVALETAKTQQPTPAMPMCDCDCDDLQRKYAELEKRVAILEAARVQLSQRQSASKVASQPAKSSIPDNYQSRWHNMDGKSRMQHAMEDHWWMDLNGKTEAEILAEMDAYHDMYGGGHAPKPRKVVNSTATTTFSTCPPEGCPPNGQVTYQKTYTQSTQNNGWYLGKNLGRRR